MYCRSVIPAGFSAYNLASCLTYNFLSDRFHYVGVSLSKNNCTLQRLWEQILTRKPALKATHIHKRSLSQSAAQLLYSSPVRLNSQPEF